MPDNGQFIKVIQVGSDTVVIDDLVTGGATVALSAEQGKLLNEKIDSLGTVEHTVADIATMNANVAIYVDGDRIFVTDASADATVTSGWAIYRHNAGAFLKLIEEESLDLTLPNPVIPALQADVTAGTVVADSYVQSDTLKVELDKHVDKPIASTPGFIATVDATGNEVEYIAPALSVDATGFDGNLSATDTTLQLVAQKFDDYFPGKNRVFADEATVAPATAGSPTEAEIQAAIGAELDTIITYNGTDTNDGIYTHIYHVDQNGDVTRLRSPESYINILPAEIDNYKNVLRNPATGQLGLYDLPEQETLYGPEQVDVITAATHDWDWLSSRNFLMTTSDQATVTVNYPTNVQQGHQVSVVFTTTNAAGTTFDLSAMIDVDGNALPDLTLANGETKRIIFGTTNALAVAALDYPLAGNIYTADGTLAGPRIVTMDANPLVFRAGGSDIYDTTLLGGSLSTKGDSSALQGARTGRIAIDGFVDFTTAEPALVAGAIYVNTVTGTGSTTTGTTFTAGNVYQVASDATGFLEYAPADGWQVFDKSDESVHDYNGSVWVERTGNGSGTAISYLQSLPTGTVNTSGAGLTSSVVSSSGSNIVDNGDGSYTVQAGRYKLYAQPAGSNDNDGFRWTQGVGGTEIGNTGYSRRDGSTRNEVPAVAFVDVASATTFALKSTTGTTDFADLATVGQSVVTIEQLPTEEVVTPGDVPVEDVRVLLGSATAIGSNSNVTISQTWGSLAASYDEVEFEFVTTAGTLNIRQTERITTAGWTDSTRTVLNADDTTIVLRDMDIAGTTANLFLSGTVTAGDVRVYGIKGQKTVINTTDTPTNDQAASGYFDIGNMRMQWGTVTATGLSSVTLPAPFANTAYNVVSGADNGTSAPATNDAARSGHIGNKTTNGFDIHIVFSQANSTGDSTVDFSWQAIGLKP